MAHAASQRPIDSAAGGARLVAGLAAVADAYEGFLVDQWGVLHDGARPYPGAVEALARLRAAGKPVVVLSNSGRRAAANEALLTELGIPRDGYDRVVTSGEWVWHALKERADPDFAGLGRRCLLFSHGGNRSIVEGLDLEAVATAEAADFILVGGTDAPAKTMADYEPFLAAGAARGLPLICANPDIVGVDQDLLIAGPGAIARRYDALGGSVRWIGKPHGEIYRAALAAFGGLAPARILAVGDSLQHDIAGGKAFGLGTALVTGGIHREDFAGAGDSAACRLALDRLGIAAAQRPDWLLPRFAWA